MTSELGCGYRCGDLLVQGTLKNNSPLRATRARSSSTSTSPRRRIATTREQLAIAAVRRSIPISFRVPVRRPVALWSPSNPALYHVQVDVVAEARIEQTQTRARPGCAARSGAPWRAVPERRDGCGCTAHRSTRTSRARARRCDSDIDTIVSELRSVGRERHPRALPAQPAAARRARRRRDHGLGTATGRPRRPGAADIGRPRRALAALRSTLLGDRNHAVGDHRLGRQRTLADAGQRLPARARTSTRRSRLRASSTRRPGGTRHVLLSGLPRAADLLEARRPRDLELLRLVHGLQGAPLDRELQRARAVPQSSHRRYPNAGARRRRSSGPSRSSTDRRRSRGRTSSRATTCSARTPIVSRLPFMNGSDLLDAARVRRGARLDRRRRRCPPGAIPDGLHHKGLIAYDGIAEAGVRSRSAAVLDRSAIRALNVLENASAPRPVGSRGPVRA